MGATFGTIIGALIGILIGSLIAAVILKVAVKWVQKADVPFGYAYGTMLLACVASAILGFVVGLAAVGASPGSQAAVVAAMWPVGFLIQSGIVSSRLGIPFGRACLVSLAMFAITLAACIGGGVLLFVMPFAVCRV